MSHSTNGSWSERKPSKKEKSCRVLLVCVYETIIFELTNEAIFNKFSRYGSITKVLIFEKGEVTKFFLEYEDLESAENAKNSEDGMKFYENICKMNIYFSNFNNVDLKHDSTEGAQFYRQGEVSYDTCQPSYSPLEWSFSQSNQGSSLNKEGISYAKLEEGCSSTSEHNVDYLDDQNLMDAFSTGGLVGGVLGLSSGFSRSKTENPKTLESEISKVASMSKYDDQRQGSSKKFRPKAQDDSTSRILPIEEEEVDNSIKYEIQSLLSETNNLKRLGRKQSLSQGNLGDTENEAFSISSKNESENRPFYYEAQHKKGQHLIAREDSLASDHTQQSPNGSHQMNGDNSVICYFYKEWVPLRQIYNLFSNFGNLECIIAKKEQVFIKFRSEYFAAVAMNYLSNTYFLGNTLKLAYCHDHKEYLPQPYQYSESLYFEESFDRFTPKKSITVNPPSDTLHVSSIKKENCNQHSLRKIFAPYGFVERVKILMQSNEKNMALVRFSSIRDSFVAISELHNKQFGGRKMQISFTKSKL